MEFVILICVPLFEVLAKFSMPICLALVSGWVVCDPVQWLIMNVCYISILGRQSRAGVPLVVCVAAAGAKDEAQFAPVLPRPIILPLNRPMEDY